jgi:hypothetical protein
MDGGMTLDFRGCSAPQAIFCRLALLGPGLWLPHVRFCAFTMTFICTENSRSHWHEA